jgi:hypothetical protein
MSRSNAFVNKDAGSPVKESLCSLQGVMSPSQNVLKSLIFPNFTVSLKLSGIAISQVVLEKYLLALTDVKYFWQDRICLTTNYSKGFRFSFLL